MLKTFGLIINILIIIIIVLRIPKENIGLVNFATKSDVLNVLTIFLIIISFGIAVQLNLANM